MAEFGVIRDQPYIHLTSWGTGKRLILRRDAILGIRVIPATGRLFKQDEHCIVLIGDREFAVSDTWREIEEILDG